MNKQQTLLFSSISGSLAIYQIFLFTMDEELKLIGVHLIVIIYFVRSTQVMESVQFSKSNDQQEANNIRQQPLVSSVPQRIPSCIVSMLTFTLLIGLAQGVCYQATLQAPSICQVCFNSNGKFVGCIISQRQGQTQQVCRNTCCPLDYGTPIPSSCMPQPEVESSEAVSVGTVLVIVFFAIPVVVCIIALIHSCVTRNNRQRTVVARVRRDDPSPSAVNLQDFNMDQSYPYMIDTEDSCSICLENKCNMVTLCGHPYHTRCFAAWIHKKNKCPLCVNRDFNPVTIYCQVCGKAVKMTMIFKRMSSEETGAWIEGSDCKCQNCLQHAEDQISINMNEEDMVKYTQWKKPENISNIKSEPILMPVGQSTQKLKPQE